MKRDRYPDRLKPDASVAEQQTAGNSRDEVKNPPPRFLRRPLGPKCMGGGEEPSGHPDSVPGFRGHLVEVQNERSAEDQFFNARTKNADSRDSNRPEIRNRVLLKPFGVVEVITVLRSVSLHEETRNPSNPGDRHDGGEEIEDSGHCPPQSRIRVIIKSASLPM